MIYLFHVVHSSWHFLLFIYLLYVLLLVDEIKYSSKDQIVSHIIKNIFKIC